MDAARAAVDACIADMKADPAAAGPKQRFIAAAARLPVTAFDPEIANALEACLAADGVDCAAAGVLWGNTLFRHPVFRVLLAHVIRRRPFWQRGNPFNAVRDFSVMLTPYVLLGLKKVVVPSLPFELFLTRLRAFLLLNARALDEAPCTALAAALAVYCFNTGYIMDCTAREKKAADALKGRDDAQSVALLACYVPLHRLENAEELEKRYAAHPDLKDAVRQQVAEPRALARQAAAVGTLTPVDDAVSLKVKGMYEESPYPRWRELHEAEFSRWPGDAAVLGKQGAQALVAGCGTGRESAQLAALYPQARILAIDITRASLAYAAAKAAEYGLDNLTYRQADIQKLPAVLKPDFDYVHCVGVLHHMEKPVEGWRTLAALVRPGGLMYIGLYGEIPRRAIVAARAAIARGRYPATDEGMRAFRRDSEKLLSAGHRATLYKANDYYYLPMYRDLLFHVQEYRFTLPEIRAALESLGLAFQGFKLPPEVFAEFHKTHADPLDLAAWEEFERRHPDTFIHSYKFWCGKAA